MHELHGQISDRLREQSGPNDPKWKEPKDSDKDKGKNGKDDLKRGGGRHQAK